MRCAILPVFCKDTERQTTLSTAWLQRLGAAVDAYYDKQSGGRANLTCTVFEWRQLGLTPAEWLAAGALVGRQVYESMDAAGILNREDFDHFVVLIDDNVSSLGVTPIEAPETTILAARGLTATITAHELGHRFQATHTYLEGAKGPIEYGGPFCVMGAEGGKYDFLDDALNVPAEGGTAENARSGPGMCFANLSRAGWADLAQHALRLQPYANGSISTVVELAALDGAPAAGQPSLPVACLIELDDWFIVEYRSGTTPYDRGVPNGQATQHGNLVVYRSPAGSALVPLQVATADVYVGRTLSLENWSLALALAQATGGTAGSPLQVTVQSVDPASRKVSLRVERRLGKAPQYERTEDMMDFLQWAIVGRDLSDLPQTGVLPLLEPLAEIHHLSRLQSLAGPRDRVALGEALQQRIGELQTRLSNMKL